jgi:hypothetical protein
MSTELVKLPSESGPRRANLQFSSDTRLRGDGLACLHPDALFLCPHSCMLYTWLFSSKARSSAAGGHFPMPVAASCLNSQCEAEGASTCLRIDQESGCHMSVLVGGRQPHDSRACGQPGLVPSWFSLPSLTAICNGLWERLELGSPGQEHSFPHMLSLLWVGPQSVNGGKVTFPGSRIFLSVYEGLQVKVSLDTSRSQV